MNLAAVPGCQKVHVSLPAARLVRRLAGVGGPTPCLVPRASCSRVARQAPLEGLLGALRATGRVWMKFWPPNTTKCKFCTRKERQRRRYPPFC